MIDLGMLPTLAAIGVLGLPAHDRGPVPPRLSLTGVFRDLSTFTPAGGFVPYELNAPFWSDGADKRRWIYVPGGPARIGFSSHGEWTFPAGTAFVKHFELAVDETRPGERRWLETRLLVRDDAGGVYGLSYRWRDDRPDAALVEAGRREPIAIKTAAGKRVQNWYFPGRADCRQCHTPQAGGVLGVSARQLNRTLSGPSGDAENQLKVWSRLGLFRYAIPDQEVPRLARLSGIDDASRSLEDRARSFLDANCAMCHRPG